MSSPLGGKGAGFGSGSGASVGAAPAPSAKGLIALRDLDDVASFDDGQVLDVSIGLPGSGSCVARVLQRLRVTLPEAVRRAGELADHVARDTAEVIVSRGRRPSAIHLEDGTDGCAVWLDYDLGPLGQTHPRVLRGLRLLITARRPTQPVAASARGHLGAAAPASSRSAAQGEDPSN